MKKGYIDYFKLSENSIKLQISINEVLNRIKVQNVIEYLNNVDEIKILPLNDNYISRYNLGDYNENI